MKKALYALAGLVVTGCQTPSGIMDTAALTAKMTTQLNSNVGGYVAASNAARQADARRLATIQEQAARRVALNANQFRVIELVGDERGRAVLASLRHPVLDSSDPRAITSASATARLQKAFSTNTYDNAPLTSVTTTVGALAKPLDAKDQLQAFASFANDVYGELKKAAAMEEKHANSPASAGGK